MKRAIAALLLAGILAGCSGATPAAPSAAATAFKPVALPGCGCGGSDHIRIMAPSLLGEGTFRASP